MKLKFLSLLFMLPLVTACQLISPVFVDYNGVRMDVARWINTQPLLSMQQKRSLVQLSKAQQRLYRISEASESVQQEIAIQNAVALQCARRNVSERKIRQLQDQVLDENRQQYLKVLNQQLDGLKLDPTTVHCE
ncbi:hypothetical protein [Acinetobacter sp. WCHAc010052]|uniref:hypothetical protein n=1 Tax=Acinetobacter sp. WCHAc010052 TaxID=2004647 RepID=UPI000B3C4EA1|nr:hypothetical protein [Acinetobacter sp. WCHAc010052]AXY59456.1 hypothetical protein CDG61_05080 [Acinetobacter sp. WCHAc010052]